jgi:hypothetical protein
MRSAFFLFLVLPAVALAAEIEHTGTYVGWGGEGEQIFRHKVAVARNNPYSDRTMIVLVDDLKRRGSRAGIARVTVEYAGGTDASANLLQAIRKKPYEYTLLKVYDTPQSPKMARVVLPRAKGVKATFRFYRTARRTITGDMSKGLIDDLTRTIDPAMLSALPSINPMRDPSIRKPRKNQELAEATPDPTVIRTVESTGELPDETAYDGVAAPSGGTVSANDPRIEQARQFARKLASELDVTNAARARAAAAEAASVEGDDAGASGPAPTVSLDGVPDDTPRMQYTEDTPEMLEAERRAAALQQANGSGRVQVHPAGSFED